MGHDMKQEASRLYINKETGLDSKQFNWRFVVGKVALREVSLFASVPSHKHSVPIFIVILILREGQVGEDWEC
jgi:hypothetical protein